MDTYIVNSDYLLALDVLLMAFAGTLALDDGRSRVVRWWNAHGASAIARDAKPAATIPPDGDGEQIYPEWLDRILSATPPGALSAGRRQALKESRTPSPPSRETREPRRA